MARCKIELVTDRGKNRILSSDFQMATCLPCWRVARINKCVATKIAPTGHYTCWQIDGFTIWQLWDSKSLTRQQLNGDFKIVIIKIHAVVALITLSYSFIASYNAIILLTTRDSSDAAILHQIALVKLPTVHIYITAYVLLQCWYIRNRWRQIYGKLPVLSANTDLHDSAEERSVVIWIKSIHKLTRK